MLPSFVITHADGEEAPIPDLPALIPEPDVRLVPDIRAAI